MTHGIDPATQRKAGKTKATWAPKHAERVVRRLEANVGVIMAPEVFDGKPRNDDSIERSSSAKQLN